MIGQNDLELIVTGLPPAEFGLFYFGPVQNQLPIGDGFRCIDPPIHRMPVMSTGTGTVIFALDYTSPIHNPGNHLFSGITMNFQFWYRDHPVGGAGFNFSDGLEVTFCD